jgi:hypothetical protein
MIQLSIDCSTLSESEKKIIGLIREKDYQTITIKIKDGKIVNIRREESIDLDVKKSLGNRKNLSL